MVGKKKCVLIGVSYLGSCNTLKGSHSDVVNLSQLLFQNFGFTQDNSRLLTEESIEGKPPIPPTRENICNSISWLISEASPGDCLFFSYSGHGVTVPDISGDEKSGFDEAIIPIDYQQSGIILDDQLNELLAQPLPSGVRLIALFDCCHSGTMLDLPFTYFVQADSSLGFNDNRVQPPPFAPGGNVYFQGDLSGATRKARENGGEGKEGGCGAEIFQFAGCKDEQKSKDAFYKGKPTGAMIYSFITSLNSASSSSSLTYGSLLRNMSALLQRSKFAQTVQLSLNKEGQPDSIPFVL